jgi:hypothetical protein
VLVSKTVTVAVAVDMVTSSSSHVFVVGVETITVTGSCGVELGVSVGMRARAMLDYVTVAKVVTVVEKERNVVNVRVEDVRIAGYTGDVSD